MKLASWTGVAFSFTTGEVVPEAAVEVRRESDGALAAIYSDENGSSPITQPGFEADAEGMIHFYAEASPDGFRIKTTMGAEERTLRHQAIGNAAQVDVTDYTRTLLLADDAADARAVLDVYSQVEVDAAVAAALAERIGTMAFVSGFATVNSALECDGTAYSRTTYADLFAKMVKSATATMTIASPCVVTWTGHGLRNNMPVKFTTTGALPTGLLAGRTYWIVNKATDTFNVALTPGGTAINTSGSQSGTHTAICAPHGDGDGSTTFNVPDMRDAVPVGWTEAAPTINEDFAPADVTTGTDTITIPDQVGKWQTGMAVVFTTTTTAPSPLVNSTTYYVIVTGSGSIKLASSLQNAQNGTAIDITTQGSGTHTITHTRAARGLGAALGEDGHAQSLNELKRHNHPYTSGTNTGAQTVNNFHNAGNVGSVNTNSATDAGSAEAANIMQPSKVGRWVIYYA